MIIRIRVLLVVKVADFVGSHGNFERVTYQRCLITRMKVLIYLVFVSSALANELTFYDESGTTLLTRIGAGEYQVTRLNRYIDVEPVVQPPGLHRFERSEPLLTPLPLE